MSQMLLGLQQSVGAGGVNTPADVKLVQGLLNVIPAALGGPETRLLVDGVCGPKTKGAIQTFQLHQFGWSGADGRVDPGGPTYGQLQALSQAGASWMFSGFTKEQEDTLRDDLTFAKSMVYETLPMLGLVPILKDDQIMYKRTLLHNFNCNFMGQQNPISEAWELTKLARIQGHLSKLGKALGEDVPFVAEDEKEFAAEAWVEGITDATVHIRPRYFERPREVRAATLLHERAHTVLPAWGHPGFGGGLAIVMEVTPDDDKRPYFTGTGEAIFEDAVRNPYCYEWLVVSCHAGYVADDYRYGGRCSGSTHG